MGAIPRRDAIHGVRKCWDAGVDFLPPKPAFPVHPPPLSRFTLLN